MPSLREKARAPSRLGILYQPRLYRRIDIWRVGPPLRMFDCFLCRGWATNEGSSWLITSCACPRHAGPR
jgi:hypothetical protein